MHALSLWRILRPGNCGMAALGVMVGIALATFGIWGTVLGTAVLYGARIEIWLGAPLAAFLITGAGNIANDLGDVAIDRQAHPDRPLVTGGLTRRQASWEAGILIVGGLAAAAWAGQVPLLAFAAANAGLLAFYEGYGKARPVVGNALVAWLVASTFLFGGYAWQGIPGVQAAAPLALMAGLANLAREALKDVEDRKGDAPRRRTLALVLGARGTWLLAAAAVALAVVYSIIDAAGRTDVPWTWLLAPAVVFAAGVAIAWRDSGRGQRILKLAMLLALIVYLLPGLLAAARSWRFLS